MVIVQYPLTGTIFDLTLGLDVILIFSSFEIFLIYSLRYKSLKNDSNTRNFHWAFIFIGYSLFKTLNVLANYLAFNETLHLFYLHYANITMSICLNLSVMLSQWFEEPKKTKKFYINITSLLISISLLFYNYYLVSCVMLIYSLGLSGFYFSKYCLKLLESSKFDKSVQKKIYFLVFSSAIYTISISLSIDYFRILFSIDVFVYQAVLGIFALHFYQYNLDHLPDYREFLWKDKLNAVYIVSNGGVLLFGRSYKSNIDFNQEFLIGGGLYSIRTIINTITSNEKLRKVELEDRVLIFDIYNEVIACAITNGYNKSIQTQLHLFLKEFYDKFKVFIEDWSGNMEVFSPAEKLCDQYLMPK